VNGKAGGSDVEDDYWGSGALSEWLATEGCTRIATEATAIWEADGQVLSDSAIAAVSDQRAHIKNVPGRNTDVNDAT
jgi:transposase